MELSNEGKDATKRVTIRQAHLLHSTRIYNNHARMYRQIEAKVIRPTKAMYKHLISFTCRTGATHTHTKAQRKEGPPLLRPVNRLRHSTFGRAGPPHNRRCRVSRPYLPGQAARQAASAGPRREELRKEDKRPQEDKDEGQDEKKDSDYKRLRKVRPVHPL